nr:cylicin-1-like isoform X1 [Ipomoea batatas]
MPSSQSELEEQLVEAGKKLLQPPSSADELLHLLEEVRNWWDKVKIRDSHPDNVFSSMATIMSLIIEESEDVSVELLTQLLASVKKDSKDIMPIGKRLGEKVFADNALKLKPYLTQAVKSLDLSLHEYSKVVTSILEGTTIIVEHSNDHTLKNQLRPEDTQQDVCSEDVSHAVNTSPKSITSNGSRTMNGGTSVQIKSVKETEHHGPDNQPATAKSETNDPHAGESVKSKSMSEHTANKEGKMSNSCTQLTEYFDHAPVDDEKDSQMFPDGKNGCGIPIVDTPKKLPAEQKGKRNDIDNLSAGGPGLEEEKNLEEKEISAHLSPEKKSKGEVVNVDCKSPSQSLPDGRHGKTVDQLKKKEHLLQEVNVSSDIAFKVSEGTSDSEAKTPSACDRKVHSEQCGSMSDLETKNLKQQGKNSDASNNQKDGLSLKKESAKESGHGKTSLEKERTKSAAKDDMFSQKCDDVKEEETTKMIVKRPKSGAKDMLSSRKSPKMSTKDDGKEKETTRTTVQRKHYCKEKAADIKYNESLVGSKVRVYWPKDFAFYEGVIHSFDRVTMKHKVVYLDGDEEVLRLKKETLEFISDDIGGKSVCATSKSACKSSGEVKVETKSKDHTFKSSGKSKDLSGVKSKDAICSLLKSKTKQDTSNTGESKQESAKTPLISEGKSIQSGIKPSGNSTAKTKSIVSRVKETGDEKESSNETEKTTDAMKRKASDASKEQETETKSGKKHRKK